MSKKKSASKKCSKCFNSGFLFKCIHIEKPFALRFEFSGYCDCLAGHHAKQKMSRRLANIILYGEPEP